MTQAENTPRVHVVAEGETLADVARKYLIPVETLRTILNIKSDEELEAHQPLNIPSEAALAEMGLRNKSYIVQDNDTLWSISRAHNNCTRINSAK